MGVIRDAAREPMELDLSYSPHRAEIAAMGHAAGYWHDEMVCPACPAVHLHTPTGRTYCGAPAPRDRVNGWTAYRSETTCPACYAVLS